MPASESVISLALPEHGELYEDVLRRLEAFQRDDVDWRRGRVGQYVWCVDPTIEKLLKAVYELSAGANGLGSRKAFPSIGRMEDEIIGMASAFLNRRSDGFGVVTSGGTESNFHAVNVAYRSSSRWRERKPCSILIADTAHPSFDKAARYLELRCIRFPTSPDGTVALSTLGKYCDDSVVFIAGSAPQFATGCYDPIPEMAAFASSKGIHFHVDACVGGFVFPFLAGTDYATGPCDLSVSGVASLSADIHKYGCGPRGTSLILFNDRRGSEHQTFSLEWRKGHYQTRTFAGSRPGASIAGAWAVMRFLGADGYRKRARDIMETATLLSESARRIDRLAASSPVESPIVSIWSVSPRVNINVVGRLLTERGWYTGFSRAPQDCIQIAVNPIHRTYLEEYVQALAWAVERAYESNAQAAFDKHSY